MTARLFYLLCLPLVLACNSETTDSTLLLQPPYDRLTDSIRQQPGNADLYYRRGALLYRQDQKAFAEKDLRQAWQLQPTEEHALSVVTALVDRHPDTAIAFIEKALTALPRSISLQVALARGYQQKNAADKALAVANRILAAHPNSIDALLLKAELLREQDRPGEALAALETAYSYAPFDVALSHNLAIEYARSKNSKVLSLADSLIRSDSLESHAEPYYFKGVYYAGTGNAAQALHFFDEAIRHDYNFLDAYMEKGALQYDLKNYDAALRTFALAIRITPSYAEAWYWTGRCHEAKNNKSEARLNYQRAYALDKTLTEARDAAGKL